MANQNNKNKTNANKKKINNNNGKANKNNIAKKSTTKKDNAVKNTIKKEVKKVEVEKEVKISKEVKEKEPVVKEKTKKEFKLTSRQKDIVLVLLVIVLLFMAIAVTKNKTPELDIELPVAVEGEAGFTEISYAEYESKMAEQKPFLVSLVQDGCGYCDMFKPVLEEVSNEYKIPIYYINLTNLSSEENSSLASSNSYLKKNKWGTPTTLFMYGDVVVDSLGGYTEKDAFVSFVKENIKVDNNAE